MRLRENDFEIENEIDGEVKKVNDLIAENNSFMFDIIVTVNKSSKRFHIVFPEKDTRIVSPLELSSLKRVLDYAEDLIKELVEDYGSYGYKWGRK